MERSEGLPTLAHLIGRNMVEIELAPAPTIITVTALDTTFSVVLAAAPKPGDTERSPQWQSTRARFLKTHTFCAACGTRDHLQVHHIQPFQTHPELELVDTNLIVLCEYPSRNCHFCFGHAYDWRAWNPYVIEDAERFRARIEEGKRLRDRRRDEAPQPG